MEGGYSVYYIWKSKVCNSDGMQVSMREAHNVQIKCHLHSSWMMSAMSINILTEQDCVLVLNSPTKHAGCTEIKIWCSDSLNPSHICTANRENKENNIKFLTHKYNPRWNIKRMILTFAPWRGNNDQHKTNNLQPHHLSHHATSQSS